MPCATVTPLNTRVSTPPAPADAKGLTAVLRHPFWLVVLATVACLALGFAPTAFWDEDEPRFAAIARTMLETGDWVVPMYNGTLAVDKPVLMHWCMAASYALLGTGEMAARLPAAGAVLATALALLRAGTLWFSPAAGIVAALAYVGCLLVGIEAHAATPDTILTALTAWATLLAAEAFLPVGTPHLAGTGPTSAPRLTARQAGVIGALTGLAVLCKGPVGFVGPMAVLAPWAWWIAFGRRRSGAAPTEAKASLPKAAFAAVLDTVRALRPGIITLAMLAVAAPWYVAVGLRTAGEWPAGFFLIHNLGRFAAPMENHRGSFLFHPLAMLVGFFPWSCYLPLAIVEGLWRVWKRTETTAVTHALGLTLVWICVWVGAFSAAATKLPNYVLPAYPAAALLVGVLGAEALRRGRWTHPRCMAAGLGWLAFGGIATAVTVLVAARYGLQGAEPAALVGLVPLLGAAACWWAARRNLLEPVAAFTATSLLFTGLAVGPAAWRLAGANVLPGLVEQAHQHVGGRARIGTFPQITPNVVYYADGRVTECYYDQPQAALRFISSGSDCVLLVREDHLSHIAAQLPANIGIVGRAHPLFKDHDFLLLGTTASPQALGAVPRSLAR